MSAQKLITGHLDLWTGAITKKSTSGRGSNGKIELTGIKKLRELILELAVRGKLLPQNQSDTPVSQLLEKVMAERESLVSQGTIKNKKPLPDIQDDEQPFELPHGWKWIRLGSIAHPQAGFAFKSREFNDREEGLPLIRIRDVGQDFSGTYYSGEYKDEFVISKGDYLISMDGIFRVAQCTLDKALLNQRVTRLVFHSGALNKGFIATGLQLRLTELQGVKAYTTVDHLSGKQISEAVIGLPPEEEQNRIVQKVDELMALCDRLEQQASDQLEAHELLVDTLLGTLTQSENAAELADNWARLAAHFDTLFTTEQSIDKLKQTILQLAVMGRLVEQDEVIPKDQQNMPSPPPGAEQLPDLPQSWNWFRLNDIADVVRGGSPRPAGDPRFYNGSIPFLKVGDITHLKGKYVTSYTYSIKEAGLKKTRFIENRTVLLSNSGATLGIPAICGFPTAFNDGIAAFINLSNDIFDEYLYLFLKSKSQWFLDFASRGQGQPNLNTDIIKSTLIPVPVMEEQHRIVQKVDELMALCDQLKERLNQASETRCQLAEAVVEQGLSA